MCLHAHSHSGEGGEGGGGGRRGGGLNIREGLEERFDAVSKQAGSWLARAAREGQALILQGRTFCTT